MLTAFKNSHGNLVPLHPIATAVGLHYLSAWRVCLSPSLSERISHPLLLQLLGASLLIPPSAPFSLSFILHFYSRSSSHFLLFSLYHLLLSCPSGPFQCRTSHSLLVLSSPSSISSCSPRPDHLLPPSHSRLTHWQKRRRRIRCELNSPAVKR